MKKQFCLSSRKSKIILINFLFRNKLKKSENSSVENKNNIEIFITDFEKEMNKKSKLGSEATGISPKSNRSYVGSLFGSQKSSNSLESVFMDEYIKQKD